MKISESNKSTLNFIIPFLFAWIGSDAILSYFGFEYSLFLDAFDIQKLLIDMFVFGMLLYIGTIGTKFFLNSKN